MAVQAVANEVLCPSEEHALHLRCEVSQLER